MASIVILVGSPTVPSRTAFAAAHVAGLFRKEGHDVQTVTLRDLPAEDLIHARATAPAIAEAAARVAAADAIVVATPVYKASFSGLLKVFLDLLPQTAFAEKSVLVIATAGAPAHVLAIDYALRPVLMSLGAAHVAPAYVLLEKGIASSDDGYVLTAEGIAKLDEMATRFGRAVARGY